MSTRKEIAEGLLDHIHRMREAGFKFLFRANSLSPEGLVTYRRPPKVGEERELVKGIRLDGDGDVRSFEEFLDWKNPFKGGIESCVAHEDDLVIVTSRDGFGIGDDPDGFTWLSDKSIDAEVECPGCGETMAVEKNFNFRDSRQMRSLVDRINLLNTQVGDKDKRIRELKVKKDSLKDAAAKMGTRAKNLEKQVGDLKEENEDLREQVDHYESILMDDMTEKVAEASEKEERMGRAEEEGRFEGMDKVKQVGTFLDRLSELNTKREKALETSGLEEAMMKLESTVEGSLEEIRGELREHERRLEELRGDLKKGEE